MSSPLIMSSFTQFSRTKNSLRRDEEDSLEDIEITQDTPIVLDEASSALQARYSLNLSPQKRPFPLPNQSKSDPRGKPNEQRWATGNHPNQSYTLLLSIKVDDPQIWRSVRSFQQAFVKKLSTLPLTPSAVDAFSRSLAPLDSLHITLNSITIKIINSEEGIRQVTRKVISCLNDILPTLLRKFLPQEITFEGISSSFDSSSSHVIYARPCCESRLSGLSNAIHDVLSSANLLTNPNRNPNPNPYMALSILPLAEMKRLSIQIDDRFEKSAWRHDLSHFHFGSMKLTKGADLCLTHPDSMRESGTGFYTSVQTFLPSPPEVPVTDSRPQILDALLSEFGVVILRGVPGVGKSSIIRKLYSSSSSSSSSSDNNDLIVVSADDFFASKAAKRKSKNATSNSSPWQLHVSGATYHHLRQQAGLALSLPNSKVVIDDYNTTQVEVNAYLNLCRRHNRTCCLFEVTCSSLEEATIAWNNSEWAGTKSSLLRDYWSKHHILHEQGSPPSFSIPFTLEPSKTQLADAIGVLHSNKKLDYVGVFLTEFSTQQGIAVARNISTNPNSLHTLLAHHVTLAHKSRIPMAASLFSLVANMLGGAVSLKVDEVASDFGGTAASVTAHGKLAQDVYSFASKVEQNLLHVTLSHGKKEVAMRSLSLLQTQSKPYQNGSGDDGQGQWQGIVGVAVTHGVGGRNVLFRPMDFVNLARMLEREGGGANDKKGEKKGK